MFQFILPIMFVLASVGVFFGYTQKQWNTLQSLKSEVAEYKKAVDNSKELLKKREALLAQKNQIPDSDLQKLDTLIPTDVNSTKLILEIEHLASTVHGLGFENPKYDPNKKVTPDAKQATDGADGKSGQAVPVTAKDAAKSISDKEFGTFELEFTITGTYDKFIAFIQDLEKSLRIVDIQSSDISVKDGVVLKYVIKVQTYWLKS